MLRCVELSSPFLPILYLFIIIINENSVELVKLIFSFLLIILTIYSLFLLNKLHDLRKTPEKQLTENSQEDTIKWWDIKKRRKKYYKDMKLKGIDYAESVQIMVDSGFKKISQKLFPYLIGFTIITIPNEQLKLDWLFFLISTLLFIPQYFLLDN